MILMKKFQLANPLLWLSGALLLHVILYFILAPGCKLTDDQNYYLAAQGILNDFHFYKYNTFTGRFIIFPIALAIKLLGNNVYALTVPTLLFGLLVILLIYSSINDKKVALVAAFALAIGKVMLTSTHIAYPDIEVLALCLLGLIYLKKYLAIRKAGLLLVSLLCLYFAILCKLSALPVAFAALIYVLINKVSIKHFGIAATILAVLTLLSAWYYQHFFQDAFYRFHIIEREHNSSTLSYHFESSTTVLFRLLTGPAEILVAFPFFAILFCIGIGLLFRFKWNIFKDFWGFFWLFTLLYAWFGSTSLHEYNPLPASMRMWLNPLMFSVPFALNNLHKLDKKMWIVIPYTLLLICALYYHKWGNVLVLAGGATVYLAFTFQNAFKTTLLLLVISLPASANYFANRIDNEYAAIKWLEKHGELKGEVIGMKKRKMRMNPPFDDLQHLKIINTASINNSAIDSFILIYQNADTEDATEIKLDESWQIDPAYIFKNKYLTIYKVTKQTKTLK